MKSNHLIRFVSILLALYIAGCAGSQERQSDPALTLLKIDGQTKPLPHKIAAILIQKPGSRFGAQLADRFFAVLVDTIRKEGRLVDLVTTQDRAIPEFMPVTGQGVGGPDFPDLAEAMRAQGFQGFVTATLSGIQTVEEKTGILWFRKTSYFLTCSMTVNVFDAFSASKLLEAVREKKFEIDQVDYEGFRDESLRAIDDLNESVADIAGNLGKRVFEVLKDQPWQAVVEAIQGDRIYFETGGVDGLQAGDALMIFQRRRTIEGKEGARFILTGSKIGTARIDALKGDLAEAVVEEGGGVQEGDLLVVVK